MDSPSSLVCDPGAARVSPEELARRHPLLYHVTAPVAWTGISRHGLLSAEALITLFQIDDVRKAQLTTRRRPTEVKIAHAALGTATLNDNAPLSDKALHACLDDGLTPEQWLRALNQRVFFWADASGVSRLLGARMNRGRPRAVLAFDTLRLAHAHAQRMEICPINSGATIRRPARRGLATFAPLLDTDYPRWQRQRGTRDRIVEIVVRDRVPDIARFLVNQVIVTQVQPLASPKPSADQPVCQ
jgi:hypothetical protein